MAHRPQSGERMTETQQVTLEISGDGWCDQPPVIAGTGFTPVTEVRLVTSCKDGAERLWRSTNGFLVSAESKFNTSLTAAVGDDYYGIAAEGHIYSLRCQDGPGHEFVLPEDGEIEFQYQLFDGGKEVWSDKAVRKSGGKQKSKNQDVPIFLLHNGTPGATHAELALLNEGFDLTSRAVLPEQPDLDPLLEEMRNAGRLHIVASGRASEAALEIAQRLPRVASVTTFSGSGLRFSPWLIEGQELAHVVCDHASLQPRGQTVLSTRKVFAEAVADRPNRDNGRIEVEKIACPIYLFSGSDDQIWPSAAFSELAAQRRKAHGLEGITRHQTFPSVGYDLGPELGLPGLPTTERTVSHSSTGFRLALGGKMGRQSRARRECWEKLLLILQGQTLQ